MVWLAQFTFWLLFHLPLKFFLRAKIVGLEKIPPKPFVLAVNHTARIDPFLLLVLPFSATRLIPIYFLTAAFYYHRWYLKPFLYSLGCYSTTQKAWTWDQFLERSLIKLKDGHVVLVFPEGQRKIGHRPPAAKPGIVHLAIKSRVPVVPLHITGHEGLRIIDFFLRKRHLSLKFGDRIVLRNNLSPQHYQPEAQKIVDQIYQLK